MKIIPWRPFSRLSITGKMLVGYVILAALTLTVVAYALASLYRIYSLNQDIVNVHIPVEAAAEKMIDTLLAQNLYEKRYLILRRKDLRHLYWERSREFRGLLENLPAGADFPAAKLARLHSRYGDLVLEMIKAVQQGDLRAADRISRRAARETVEPMLAMLEGIPPRARSDQDRRMKQISEESGTAFRTIALLCAVSMGTGALAGFLIIWYISSSLRMLRDATVRVAEGDFDTRLRVRGDDEISDLKRAFEAMGGRLKKMEEMYIDASPLTRLPGGIAIEREVQRRIDRNEPLAFCVMDLDNFKAFNDRYGYARGNEVIKEAARIIEGAARRCGAPGDFVGHVGGDDFIVVTLPERMHDICREIVGRFDERIPAFYSDQDRASGYIPGKTRQGIEMKFPLMTISIAVVTNAHRSFSSPLEASEVAAELKDHAKTFNRSLYVVDKRRT